MAAVAVIAAAVWQPARPAAATGHRSAAGRVKVVPLLAVAAPTEQSTPRSSAYHSFGARPAPRFRNGSISSGPAASPPAVATALQAQAVGGTLLNLGYIAGVTDSSDAVPDVEPPDTQVATGPTDVVEAVNNTLAIYTRSGHLVRATDLDTFFSIPTQSGFFFSDPRIVYDNESGSDRFILTGMGVQLSPGASNLYLAVSRTSDPTQPWNIYEFASSGTQVNDQPKVGVDSDKIVVSWQSFDRKGNFVDVVTEVIQKSDALAGAALETQTFAPDSTRFGLVPAISLSATNTEYVVYNNSCGQVSSCTAGTPTIGVIAITGTPANGDVVSTETDPPLSQGQEAPFQNPVQPGGFVGGSVTSVNPPVGDDRLLSAVWRQGTLWISASDNCNGRTCGRVMRVATSATTSVTFDTEISLSNSDVYYPAITLDSAGDPFVVATTSSATRNPTVAVFGESGSSGGFRGFLLPTPGGSQPYAGQRWGDYSGASIDPVHPDDVWLAGEYAIPVAANRYPNWATILDDVTLSSPTVTGISPRSGSAAGGTSVTVAGTNFTPATAVSKVPEVDFGSRASTRVIVQSPTQLVAVSPPEGGGPVHITVKTADGRSPATAADVFTYPVCGTARGPALPDAVGIAAVAISNGCSGYLVTDRAGQISAFGSAVPHGDLNGKALAAPIIAVTATADGKGYWLLASDGGVFTFGDARFYGSTGNIRLNAPVVAMAVTPTGKGYWILAKDGGIFTFGDARFFGSTGNIALAKPIDGMAVAPGGNGYWLVAQDGGVFTFTHDGFYGSLGGVHLAAPIVGMSSAPSGRGYTLVGSDGGVFTFGAAPFYGSLGAHPPPSPIVDLSTVPADNGYYLVDATAHVYAFGPGATFYGNA